MRLDFIAIAVGLVIIIILILDSITEIVEDGK
jgi:hypothetical protein